MPDTAVVQMQALGSEPTPCCWCKEPFRRGEQIASIPTRDGERVGWFCESCTGKWRAGTLGPAKEDDHA